MILRICTVKMSSYCKYAVDCLMSFQPENDIVRSFLTDVGTRLV